MKRRKKGNQKSWGHETTKESKQLKLNQDSIWGIKDNCA